MDDKFLYQLQEPLDDPFVEKLHQKLVSTHVGETSENLIRSTPMKTQPFFTNKGRLAWTLAFVVLIVAAFSFSPVRAFITTLVREVGGYTFEETEAYPGFGEDETIIEPQILSLDEAIAAFPAKIRLPTNVPENFVLNENEVRLYIGEAGQPFSDSISFEWKPQAGGGYLTLTITNQMWKENGEVVAPGAVEEVSLNENVTGVVIRGGWAYDQKAWNDEINTIRLRWAVGDLDYELQAAGDEMSIEDLTAIALTTIE